MLHREEHTNTCNYSKHKLGKGITENEKQTRKEKEKNTIEEITNTSWKALTDPFIADLSYIYSEEIRYLKSNNVFEMLESTWMVF